MTDGSGLGDPATGVLSSVVREHDEFVVVLDTEGRLRAWTDGLETAADRPPSALDGVALAEVVVGDGEGVADAVEAALAEGAATVDVALPGDETGYELRLARGEDGVVGVARPASPPGVDEQRVLERTTDAVFAVDTDWEITYVNEQARPILASAMGVDHDAEMVGRELWESIPDAVGTLFHDRYHEAMERQEPVTFEAEYEPLETIFEVRAYPSETGLSVYFRDVTEDRERRTALLERERVLREMYEVTSDADRDFEDQVGALLELAQEVLDADFGVLSEIVGDEYVHRVARSPGELIEPGMRVPLSATVCERTAAEQRRVVLADIIEDDPEIVEKIDAADHDWEWPVNCYVGAPVIVEDEVYGTFCFYDGESREEGFSEWETTVVDIMAQWVGYELTKRRASERLRAQNEQLDEFVSVVSHDLRNPLETLSGHLELAAETGDEEHFEWCRRAITRMDDLIDDLLALGRAGATVGETEPVDLADVVRRCWAIVDAGDADLRVETTRTVDADRSRLRQMLENLFRNAVEHAGPGVSITVGDTETGFYVADDGPGVPEADRERVFETGFSTDDDGTGFGLNIVRQVAEAHGWSVDLVAAQDGGARFEFTL